MENFKKLLKKMFALAKQSPRMVTIIIAILAMALMLFVGGHVVMTGFATGCVAVLGYNIMRSYLPHEDEIEHQKGFYGKTITMISVALSKVRKFLDSKPWAEDVAVGAFASLLISPATTTGLIALLTAVTVSSLWIQAKSVLNFWINESTIILH